MRNTMIKISEYCNNIIRNFFVSVLLTMMAVLVLISTSLIMHEWEQYEPFSVFSDKKGMVYYVGSDEIKFSDNPICYETYRATCMMDGMNLIDCLVYPDWVINSWTPRLKKGKWISDNEQLGIVVGGNKVPYKIGQKITMKMVSRITMKYEDYEFEIVGILAENTKMFNGNSSYDAEIKGYNMFYNVPDTETFFVINSNILEGLNVDFAPTSGKVMIYPDEMEQDRFDRIYKEALAESGGMVTELKTFLEDSKKLVMLQIKTYIPIVLFGLVLIIIGIVISAYINMKMSMPHSVVFYLIGATPKDRFMMYFSETIINIVVSILLLMMMRLTFSETGFQGTMVIEYSSISYYMLGIYYALVVMTSVVYYMLVWKRVSPKEALIKQRTL